MASFGRVAFFLFSMLLLCSGIFSVTFTLSNNCPYTTWPGILANAGKAPLSTTGFELKQGASMTLTAPSTWSGRLWARTDCTTDSNGKFTCRTGDCGSSIIECSGGGAAPPASLAEFTLGNGALDFYDVSLVDGFNLPMLVSPQGGSGNCMATGCLVDLNRLCPSLLQVSSARNGVVACKSACEYCCDNPETCKRTPYSQFFKNACPRVRSYVYDNKTSTFTCAAANYAITFCPSIFSRTPASSLDPKATGLPLVNITMTFSSAPSSDRMVVPIPRWARGLGLILLVAVVVCGCHCFPGGTNEDEAAVTAPARNPTQRDSSAGNHMASRRRIDNHGANHRDGDQERQTKEADQIKICEPEVVVDVPSDLC